MLSFATSLGVAGLVAIEYTFVFLWMGFKVGAARKKFGITYPQFYARLGDGNCKDQKATDTYNCVQRAHQNTLETTPTFLIMFALSCVYYPFYAAIAAQVYVFGRVAYFLGYSTGDPKARMRGTFGYIGLISLLLMAVGSCVRLIQEDPKI